MTVKRFTVPIVTKTYQKVFEAKIVPDDACWTGTKTTEVTCDGSEYVTTRHKVTMIFEWITDHITEDRENPYHS